MKRCKHEQSALCTFFCLHSAPQWQTSKEWLYWRWKTCRWTTQVDLVIEQPYWDLGKIRIWPTSEPSESSGCRIRDGLLLCRWHGVRCGGPDQEHRGNSEHWPLALFVEGRLPSGSRNNAHNRRDRPKTTKNIGFPTDLYKMELLLDKYESGRVDPKL